MPVKILHQGLISRTVRDTASFYAAVERVRPARRLPTIGHVEGPGARRRIRFFTRSGLDADCHPECVEAIRDLAMRLQAEGHDVDEIESPFDESLADDFLALWSTMTFGLVRLGRLILHPRFDNAQVEPFTRDLAQRWVERWHEAPGAILRLRRFRSHYEELFKEFDVLLTPTLATPPPRIGHVGPEVPYSVAIERLREFLPYTAVQNVSGAPAISLPAGLSSEGLPIGAQFAAAHGQERTLLELAYEVESLKPVRTRGLGALDYQGLASRPPVLGSARCRCQSISGGRREGSSISSAATFSSRTMASLAVERSFSSMVFRRRHGIGARSGRPWEQVTA